MRSIISFHSVRLGAGVTVYLSKVKEPEIPKKEKTEK